MLEIVLLAYYRHAFNLKNAWWLILASVIGVPLGVLFLKRLDAELMMAILGLVIAGYALYALLRFRLPTLEHKVWGWGFGLLAGSYSAPIWRDTLLGIPLMAAGIVAGLSLNRYINPDTFRKLVLGLLIILGFLAALSAAKNPAPLYFRIDTECAGIQPITVMPVPVKPGRATSN